MNIPFMTLQHFDNFKEDKEGEYVKIVGRFNADWSDEVVLLRGGLSDLVFAKEYNIQHTTYNTQGYNHAANAPSKNHSKEDAENPYGDPTARIFSHFKFSGYEEQLPKIQAMTDFLI